MFKTKRSKTIFLIVDLVLLILLAAAVFIAQTEKTEVPDTQDDVESYYSRFIEYDGQVYPVRRGLESILLIGKDAMEGRRPVSDVEDLFYNDDLSDFLLLLAFDHNGKTVRPFQLNRDTMTDVPWISVNGLVGGYTPLQLEYAHIFGSGKEDSSKNVVTAVQGLLHGAPVDHYFTFSMDTVPIMNDLVGGVTVTLEDDIPTLGPEYIKGATITLKGMDALRFVRAREFEPVDANVPRMAHQRLYMNAFILKARQKLETDSEFVIRAYDKIEKYLITDLTVEKISQLIGNFYDYEVLPVVTPTGSYTVSEVGVSQFHADEASLWDCVRTTFCAE